MKTLCRAATALALSTMAFTNVMAAPPGQDHATSSSIRWKENVQPIGNAVDKVKQIRGVFFDWKEQYGGEHDIGFIAEEIGKVIPELTVWETIGGAALGVKYDRVPALLVEAVKEQQTQLDRQRDFLETQQKQLEAQETLISNQQSQISQHTDTLTVHATELGTHDTSITLLQKDNIVLKEMVKRHEQEIAELKAAIAALQSSATP